MDDVTPHDDLSLRHLIRADLQATTHQSFGSRSPARFWLRVVAKTLLSSNVRAVIVYRLGHRLAQKGFLPLALLLRTYGIRTSGAELNPLASIGPGLYVAHSVGVGVGAYVVIGSNCRLHLGSVIGPQPHGSGEPQYTVIGNDVYIGTHAVVLGGVTIGDGASIGPNAVVMRDVAPYEVIVASPARTVGQRNPDDIRT